jgi:hypothetical protein
MDPQLSPDFRSDVDGFVDKHKGPRFSRSLYAKSLMDALRSSKPLIASGRSRRSILCLGRRLPARALREQDHIGRSILVASQAVAFALLYLLHEQDLLLAIIFTITPPSASFDISVQPCSTNCSFDHRFSFQSAVQLHLPVLGDSLPQWVKQPRVLSPTPPACRYHPCHVSPTVHAGGKRVADA